MDSAGNGGTDLDTLQGWIINFGDYRKKLRISVESFVYWMSNQNPPWDAYWAFIFRCLIVLNNILGVRLVGVGETWCQFFSKCILKVTGSEANHA